MLLTFITRNASLQCWVEDEGWAQQYAQAVAGCRRDTVRKQKRQPRELLRRHGAVNGCSSVEVTRCGRRNWSVPEYDQLCSSSTTRFALAPLGATVLYFFFKTSVKACVCTRTCDTHVHMAHTHTWHTRRHGTHKHARWSTHQPTPKHRHRHSSNACLHLYLSTSYLLTLARAHTHTHTPQPQPQPQPHKQREGERENERTGVRCMVREEGCMV